MRDALKMTQDVEILKSEMDAWVKDFRRELDGYSAMPSLVEEHDENIDHNYELIQEMRAEMKKLKEEVSALRLVQLLHLESQVQRTQKIRR